MRAIIASHQAKLAAYDAGILTLSVAVAGFTYYQTSRWTAARDAWLTVIFDAVWLIGSLVALRCLGYRLAHESTIRDAEYIMGEPAHQGRLPTRHRRRIPRLAILVPLSVLVLWVGDESMLIILLDDQGMMETLHKYFPEAMIVVRP